MKGFRVPPRNPRTNPFGKYVTGYFNFRTEMFPLAPQEETSSWMWKALPVWTFFGGLFFGSYYAYNNLTEAKLWQNEQMFLAQQSDSAKAVKTLNYPEQAKAHTEPIPPYRNFITTRPDMAFGSNGVYASTNEVHPGVITNLRRHHDDANSLLFQFGHNWNSFRYTKAKPAEDYDAVRLKALFNLAAAAYHEGRRPSLHLPLAVQARVEAYSQQNVYDESILDYNYQQQQEFSEKYANMVVKKAHELQ